MKAVRKPLHVCVAVLLLPTMPGWDPVDMAVAETAAKSDDGARLASWNQYLGPKRDNISPESGWLVEWPKEGPKQLWKAGVGTGFATVTISGGRVYTVGHVSDNNVLYCLDADTGKEVWHYKYPAPLMAKQHEGGPCATPTLDGGLVYVHGKQGQLLCLTADKGELVWRKDLDKELGAKMPTWGFAGSPLVEGDLLITDAGYAAAFNKKTGELVWKSADNYGAGYSSPVAFDHGGKRCVAIFNGLGLVILAVADGKEICRFPWDTNYDVNAATPLINGNEIFISSGYDKGAALLRLAGDKPEVVWQNKNMRNHFNTSVVWKGFVYGFDESNLTCLEYKTGKPMWSQRGLGKGSLMMADGKLIILSERGELVIAEPNPEKYERISGAQVLGGKCWTVPVLFDGRVYCRNAKGDLVCMSVKRE